MSSPPDEISALLKPAKSGGIHAVHIIEALGPGGAEPLHKFQNGDITDGSVALATDRPRGD